MANVDMTQDLPLGFAHDEEHPQVEMPFTVKLAGRRLKGQSISVTKAVATGLLPGTLSDRAFPVTLRFDLESLSITLFLNAVVSKSSASENAEVVLHFTDPTGAHLAPLRYLINSYIAGDIVSVSGILGYTGPVSVKARADKERPGLWRRLGYVGGRLTVFVLTGALIFLATDIVLNRAIYANEPRPVIMTRDGQSLRATTGGQITYVDPVAGEGDVLFSLTSNSGEFLSVRMPCDCTIQPQEDFAVGATVLPGAVLAKLVGEDSRLIAETDITYEGSARALAGDAAQLLLEDGTIVEVGLTMLPKSNEGSSTQPVRLELPPAVEVAEGSSARLRFRRALVSEATRDQVVQLRTSATDWLTTTWAQITTRISN